MKTTSNEVPRLKRTIMYWLNPKTHNLVCYQRASQLHLINRKDVKCGFKNPKTNRLISPARAIFTGLVSIG